MAESESTSIQQRFGPATPILPVRSLEASVDYYVQILGFQLDFLGPGAFASVSRGGCTLFLCQGDQGHTGTWAWIGVADAAALWEQFRLCGARLRQAPTNHPWALEIQIEDLEGNVLRFGSDPIASQPYGEWMDMNGRLWKREDG
jgi:catechol 2,3-dioxygenase-like lactoylglutathione lyase family enzyme